MGKLLEKQTIKSLLTFYKSWHFKAFSYIWSITDAAAELEGIELGRYLTAKGFMWHPVLYKCWRLQNQIDWEEKQPTSDVDSFSKIWHQVSIYIYVQTALTLFTTTFHNRPTLSYWQIYWVSW